MSINDQLRRGFGADKLMVSDRRYPVLDEGRGILVMIGVMNLDTPARPPQTPGAAPTGPAGHAAQHVGMWKQIIVEFFKVADGMIQEIQATVYDLDNPAIQSPGWPAVPGTRATVPPAARARAAGPSQRTQGSGASPERAVRAARCSLNRKKMRLAA